MMRIVLALLFGLFSVWLSPAPAPVVDPPETVRKDVPLSSMSEEGEYKILVPARATVGPGPAYIFAQFNLLKGDTSGEGYYNSVFLADAQPITEDMAFFQEDFASASAYMTERATDMFGTLLREITFETLPNPGGSPIYVMRLWLDDGSFPMAFTAAWHFEKSYAASYLGVNLGDKPDMDALVLRAAEAFEDDTAAPGTADPKMISTGQFSYDAGPWDLPVKNVLGLVGEYALRYRPFRGEPSADEDAIVWKHDYMEVLSRQVAGKPEGPIYPSDLEHIERIDFTVSETHARGYTIAAYGPYAQTDIDDAFYSFWSLNAVEDLDGLEHFRGVTFLELSLPNVVDVTALGVLNRVERAMLAFSPEITDLSPMGGMSALRYLMMWGYECSLVEDISFFQTLTNLETVFFIDRSISDARVFTRLPSLSRLLLIGAETLDKQPLIECAHIEELIVNGEQIR